MKYPSLAIHVSTEESFEKGQSIQILANSEPKKDVWFVVRHSAKETSRVMITAKTPGMNTIKSKHWIESNVWRNWNFYIGCVFLEFSAKVICDIH